jgi:CBS domain-containing protein
MSVLSRAKVYDIVASKESLVDVSASTPIVEVLSLLEEQQILSVPVFGAPGSWAGAGGDDIVVGNKQYIGIISVLDLVAYIFRNSSATSSSEDPSAQETMEMQRVLVRPISSAIGSTDESLSIWIESAQKDVLDAMEQFSKGVHRALVLPVTAEANEVKLLTQTDVVSFLLKIQSSCASLERIFNSKLKDLRRPDHKKDLVSVSISDGLIQALHIVLESKVHGVAVVDDEGKLASILSVSDLRGIVAARLPSMRPISVNDFLRQKEPRSFDEPLPTPFTCTRDDRLGDIVDAMLQQHFHRIWLVNDAEQPTDVLTLTDIIYIVWKSERSTYLTV